MEEMYIIIILFICAFYDGKCGKIPNLITIPFFISGFIFSFLNHGILSLATIICNLLIIIIIFGHGFITRCIGGGDIKLLMAIACWMELKIFVIFVVFTLLSGAVLALHNIFIEQKVYQAISSIRNINLYSIVEKIKKKNGKKLAYGICILVGYLFTFFTMKLVI